MRLAESMQNLLTVMTFTFTSVVMETTELVRFNSLTEPHTPTTHSPSREEPSQNSTPEQPTKVTETQNLTMLSMRDYPETLRQ